MGETQPPQLKDSRPLSPFDESLVPRAHSLEPTAVNLLFEPVSPAKVSLLVDLPPPTTSPLRVRVVGRVIGIDLVNEVILIADQGVAIVVKLTAARAGVVLSSYNPSLKDLVMITGLWSLPDIRLTAPRVEAGFDSPEVATGFIHATLLKPCEELDLERWREVARLLPN